MKASGKQVRCRYSVKRCVEAQRKMKDAEKNEVIAKAYRYRAYPTPEQQKMSLGQLELCRRIYNCSIQERKEHYKATGKGLNYQDQQDRLPEYKEEHPEYKAVHSQVLQDVLRRVDRAYVNFFEGRARYPKFKKYGGYRSVTYPQITQENIGRNSILLPKIGRVRIVKHRPLKGKPKTLTFVHSKSGEWFVAVTAEQKSRRCLGEPKLSFRSPAGADSGLIKYVYLSDGSSVDNPRFIAKHQKRIIKAQRKLSRKKRKVKKTVLVNEAFKVVERPSDNWLKARQVLAKRWRDYVNAKEDWQWKLAGTLVEKYDFIGYEDLPIGNMLKNHNLARSIQDAAWGGFWSKVESKAVTAASTVTQKVPAQYTTQECSKCHFRHKVALSERTFQCPSCGHIDDRDHNASDTVLQKALKVYYEKIGMDMPESTPVEIEPLPPNAKMMEASSISESGNKFSMRRQNPEFASADGDGKTTHREAHTLQRWEDVTKRLSGASPFFG